MAKNKKYYKCRECGYKSLKWQGRCPTCELWDTFEECQDILNNLNNNHLQNEIEAVNICSLEVLNSIRFKTGIGEFDKAIGGGLVKGMVALVGGDPGIGKSTLMLQLSSKLAAKDKKVVYISGEESPAQIKLRAERIEALENYELYPQTCVESILKWMEINKPDFAVIDSIQTLISQNNNSLPGSVNQMREVAYQLANQAKKTGCAIFIIGHVTKEGMIAGPRVIEHIVDTVLYFEGDKYYNFRILRSIKNRFGPANELGIFEMEGKGLVETKNPSHFFLNGHKQRNSPGSAVTAATEGSRVFLIEIQALVVDSSFGNPQRNCVGYDFKRVAKLVAVLEKYVGISLKMMDLFINVTGGGKLNDPATDLSVCISIFSSYANLVIDSQIAFFGEIGLNGELRSSAFADQRIREATKLGFKKIIGPENIKKEPVDGIEYLAVSNINQALELIQ